LYMQSIGHMRLIAAVSTVFNILKHSGWIPGYISFSQLNIYI
jgi:hypothetical protein